MKKTLLAFIAIVGSLLLTASCKKDSAAEAHLMIVNASPNAPAIDGAVNGSVIATGIAYPNNSGYKTTSTGNFNIRITQTGTSTVFIDGTLTAEAGAYYSLYMVDSLHKRKATVIRDDLSAPSSGKSKIRLLHFSPDAPAVDVFVNGAASTNFSNRGFNDVQSNATFAGFTEVNAGNIDLQIRLAGTSTVLATIPTITLTAGKIYTVIIKGFAAGTTTQALGAAVISHN
jgi:hypothetical protein